MRFRPCIDLHKGEVKQIVGSSLRDSGEVEVNFSATESAAAFADMYRRDGLVGGHVIMLGAGNVAAAATALAAYPGGLQIGGGINPKNAHVWLERGAAKVIVTSYLFVDGRFCWDRLDEMAEATTPGKLVVDLSCVAVGNDYFVATNRWQTVTRLKIDRGTLTRLAQKSDEFLVHAVDVEGKRQGIDTRLVERLGAECPGTVTYAGGVASLADLELIERLGDGRVDATVGSALDIFGGTMSYRHVVEFDRLRR